MRLMFSVLSGLLVAARIAGAQTVAMCSSPSPPSSWRQTAPKSTRAVSCAHRAADHRQTRGRRVLDVRLRVFLGHGPAAPLQGGRDRRLASGDHATQGREPRRHLPAALGPRPGQRQWSVPGQRGHRGDAPARRVAAAGQRARPSRRETFDGRPCGTKAVSLRVLGGFPGIGSSSDRRGRVARRTAPERQGGEPVAVASRAAVSSDSFSISMA